MYQNNQQVVMINIDDILPNRFQPRLKFNEEEILNLAESIKEHGVIQPIVVRKLGDRYELIAGERRTKASTMAGKTTIPAIIVDMNDTESAEVALIENVQRQDLTSIEEAISYRKILDMGYLNQSQLAEKVGKKQSTIANKLRLLTLPKEVQSALLETKISERHARSLLKLDNKEKQTEMLDKIIKERLTVRKTDQEIDKIIEISKMEVLDILPIEKETVKGEEKMDNNFNFNDMEIPSTNIINDINNSDINEVTSINENQNNVFNPGFMDIDKIADQAQDIKTDNVVFNVNPEQIIPTIPEETKAEEIPTPKFFNILEDIPKPEVKQESIIDEPKVEPLNNLDIFNIQSSQTKNDSEVSIQPSEKITNIEVVSSEENIEEQQVINNHEEVVIPTINDDIDDIAIIDDNTFGYEETNVVIEQPQEPIGKPLLKDAIAKTRSLSDALNNMGYIVDTEEIDFDDLYQIIIKIQK